MSELITKKYINAFFSCDLATLDTLLADDIVLNDKNLQHAITNKQAFITFVETFHKTADNVSLIKCNVFKGGENQYFAKLALMVNSVKVEVIDVISFQDSKIASITAYFS